MMIIIDNEQLHIKFLLHKKSIAHPTMLCIPLVIIKDNSPADSLMILFKVGAYS